MRSPREFHDHVHGFRHFGEARIAAVRGRGPDLRRLVREHVACGVLAIDADVPFGAAAELAIEADVAGLHLHRELRIEVTRVADASSAHEICATSRLQRSKCRRYAVMRCTPLRSQASIMRSQSLHARRQRLLTQHVQAGARRREWSTPHASCWAARCRRHRCRRSRTGRRRRRTNRDVSRRSGARAA